MPISPTTRAWIRNAADERAASRGARFNIERGSHAVWWIERICKLYEGEHAGEPMILHGCRTCGHKHKEYPEWDAKTQKEFAKRADKFAKCMAEGHELDWQYEYVMRRFGWVMDSKEFNCEVRRFTRSGVWVAKKNKKCLALDTPLPTPAGWTTMGAVQVGDRLFDENGLPCRVVDVSPVYHDKTCYEVVFSDGTKIIADAEHLWETRTVYGPKSIKTTEQIRETLYLRRQATGEIWANNHSIDVAAPIQPSKVAPILPIAPYVLGCWLGDGDSDGSRITLDEGDTEVLDAIAANGESVTALKRAPGRTCRFAIGTGTRHKPHSDPLCSRLQSLGVLKKKQIPIAYLRASIEQRKELLCGLMDTDGHCSKRGYCTFSTTSDQLAEGFLELIASLGLKGRVRECRAKCKGRYFRYLDIKFAASFPVFKLSRKANRQSLGATCRRRSQSRQIVAINPVPTVPVRCVEVDSPSHLYLAGRSMIPTHNTPTLAATALYVFCGDGEPGQKVYLAAKDGEQARIAGLHVVKMFERSPDLSQSCTLNKTLMQLIHHDTDSIIKPISSGDSRAKKSKEGLNGSVFVDETHVVDADYMSVLEFAGISRKEPCNDAFSTAGDDPQSYGFAQFEYGKAVNEGKIDDDRYLFMGYYAPQGVSDEELKSDPIKYGKMANPAWGNTVRESEFLDAFKRSLATPAAFADFKKYRFNIWQKAAVVWLPVGAWEKNERKYTEADLLGRDCYAAVDLARTLDTSSLVLCFPEPVLMDEAKAAHPGMAPGDAWLAHYQSEMSYRLLAYFWLPEATAEMRSRDVMYQQWAKDNWIELTPGDVTDYTVIEKRIREIIKKFNVRKLAFDRKFATELMQRLAKDAMSVEEQLEFPQTLMQFCGPTALFERLVISGKLLHDGNPLLAWQAGNTYISNPDANGNIRPVKQKHGDIRTIDGIVAAIMALGLADQFKDEAVYQVTVI